MLPALTLSVAKLTIWELTPRKTKSFCIAVETMLLFVTWRWVTCVSEYCHLNRTLSSPMFTMIILLKLLSLVTPLLDTTLLLEVSQGGDTFYFFSSRLIFKFCDSPNMIADVTGTIRIWDTVNAEHICKIELRFGMGAKGKMPYYYYYIPFSRSSPLSSQITDIAWSEDSQRIVVCGEGKEWYVWCSKDQLIL